MNVDVEAVVRLRAELLADVLRRLRRRVSEDEYAVYLLDVAGGHVETLHQVVSPTAAEIYRANREFGAGDEESVEAALADVDGRVRWLRSRLGVRSS